MTGCDGSRMSNLEETKKKKHGNSIGRKRKRNFVCRIEGEGESFGRGW
jgi:hypothetical protein